jgi:hypothetical protein
MLVAALITLLMHIEKPDILDQCQQVCREYGLAPMVARTDLCICGNNGIIKKQSLPLQTLN